MKILVTGGCGFIGSNLVRHVLRSRPGLTVVNLDNLSYAGNLESLADLEGDPRHRFVHGDICDRDLLTKLIKDEGIEQVMHLAAESHVDRSIMGPEIFSQTNVVGTSILLEASRKGGVKRFLHVSTDEVYGSLGPTGYFTETTPLAPSSPYSASKAGSDFLALAYHHTFKMDVLVSRCSNNYGPYQFPEKLIPLMIANALADKPLPVYGDGMNVREWLHVEDHNEALLTILERGRPGEVYNIGSGAEQPNIEIVKRILAHLGKPETLIRYVTDRPGHDRRYAIDATKLRTELGWKPRHAFESGLRSTIDWYVANRPWWERITSGEYRTYYERAYRDRIATAAGSGASSS
jgi:dTDP-glucose 4,6-dehydratase